MTDASDVWVYLEAADGEVSTVGYEMLGKSRELADALDGSVTALLAGPPGALDDLTDDIVARGADTVVLVEDDRLETYRPETFATAVEAAVRDGEPGVLLVGATHNGIDLAGRLAVRLDAGLTADVTRLEIDEDGELVGGVPAFAGGILAMVKATGSLPQMSTVRPGVFDALDPDPDREGTVERFDPGLADDDVVTEVLDREVGASVDLPSADVVVAAGRGFGDDLELAEELAGALGATVGVTRPLCDEGLVSRDRQIGTTGFSLKADLCVVAGISGAVHFTAGIEDCDTVVAINTDPEEPIFDHADYCVEGDLFEVLPALLDELEAMEVAP
ncbi:MAG: electron transfer flavoprotein subunit alpha/FixB family protein [Halobacteriales archaeon]